MNQTGTLDVVLPGALPPTPYARLGLLLPLGLALAMLGAGVAVARRRPGCLARFSPAETPW
jgi:apolipoprotein N-acyltransferase